jgi:hypothetical protein
LGANQPGNFLAAVGFSTPNDLRLYDVTIQTNDPILLDWEFFTPNNAGFAVGNAAFGKDRIYALSANNGVLAMKLNWPQVTTKQSGSTLTLAWPGMYKLQTATNVAGPYENVSGQPVSGGYQIDTTLLPRSFYRITYP